MSFYDDLLSVIATPGILIPWDVSTAVYANKYVSILSQDSYPRDTFFDPSGSRMYVIGVYNKTIYQYDLSTAWDVSTATYSLKYKSVAAQDGNPFSIIFKPDGSSMYIIGFDTNRVYQYTLSTAWDISTATYASKFITVTSQDIYPRGMFIDSDGLSLYVVGYGNKRVFQYTLSTAWDISTATYTSKYADISSQDAYPRDVFFGNGGSSMYVVGGQHYSIYQYSLSTAWDVSTSSYYNKQKLVSAQDGNPFSVFFKDDGLTMYIAGPATSSVYQYNLV